MSRLVLPRYKVIRDTREKYNKGWFFDKHTYTKRKPPNCDGMVVQTLETGDYSLVGYEDILSIERKKDFAELWGNYQHKERFTNEMERMSSFKHKIVFIESSLTTDILDLSPPQFTTGVPGKALIRWLMSLTVKYGVPFIPIGSCGQKVAQQFMEEVIRFEKDRWVEKDDRNT